MFTDKFENLYKDFQNDPQTRKKYIFYIGSAISFVVLISLMLYLSSLTNSDNKIKNNQVQTKNLTNQNSSQLISTAIYPYQGGVQVSADGVIGLTEKGNLIYRTLEEYSGLNTYNGTGNYLIKSIEPFKDQATAIINTTDQSVYLFESSQIKRYPESILSLTQVNPDNREEGYYLIRQTQDGYNLELASDIELEHLTSVLTTFTSLGDYSQVVSMNNSPYLLTWSGNSLAIQAFSSQNKTLQNVQFIRDYQSSYIKDSKIIYNKVVNSKNQVGVIDFTKVETGKNTLIDTQQKSIDLGLEGYIFGKRCIFTGEYEISCLVKKNDSSIYTITEEDKIISHNYLTGTNSLLFPNIGAFSAHNLYQDSEENIYILEASSNTIWNLKE